jgi:hypothetical protein
MRHIFLKSGNTVKTSLRFYIVTKLKKRKQIFLIFQFPVFTVLPNLRKEKYFSFSNFRFLQCYQT